MLMQRLFWSKALKKIGKTLEKLSRIDRRADALLYDITLSR